MDTLFPLTISDTDMTLLSECELKWFRSRCQWLRPRVIPDNIDLIAGAAFADGIATARKAYYDDGVDSAEAVEMAASKVLDTLLDSPVQDDLKSPERMSLAIRMYFKNYPLVDAEIVPFKLKDGKHSIEVKFAVELPVLHPELNVPLIYKGRLDMFGQSTSFKRPYIVDEKTCKQVSSKDGELAITNGQFLGYGWVIKQLIKQGLDIPDPIGVLVRKIAIQSGGIVIPQEIECPLTDFIIDAWEASLISKLRSVVAKYKHYKEYDKEHFRAFFFPDYKLGCTSFFKVCAYQTGCMSKYGDGMVESSFVQEVWEPEEREVIPLADFKAKLGL